jgi:hypothetical protein
MNSLSGKAGEPLRFIRSHRRNARHTSARRARQILCLGVFSPLAYLGVSTTHGQEALRMSVASAEAAEARREAMELDYCNLKWKSITARIDASAGLLFQDNVFYSEKNPQSDFTVIPSVLVKSVIPLTDINSLYFSSGIGYMKYTRFDTLDSFFITPDSTLQMNIYTGDFVINVHDRFTLTENGAQIPSLYAANNMGRFENTSGVGADWDLNKVILSSGLDYKLTQYSYTDFDYMNHNDVLLNTAASYEITRTLHTGLEGGVGMVQFDKDYFGDKLEYNAGPFVDAKLSDYLSTKLSAGYVNYDLSSDHLVDGASNIDSYYTRWSIRNRLTRYYSHQLQFSHSVNLGTYYEMDKLYSIAYYNTFLLSSKTTLKAGVQYQTGQQFYPDHTWDVNGVNTSLTIDYQWARKLKSSASYFFSTRDTPRPDNSYSQNRLAISLTYTF